MDNLALHIEAAILASANGIGVLDLLEILQKAVDPELSLAELTEAIDQIRDKYESSDQVLQLTLVNNSYQFLTKSCYHSTVAALQSFRERKALSQSALETLAIVAYRQPITKVEIEQIRGVNCDYSIQRLLERELIQIVGKADTVGRPLLYATSEQFMHYFGINTLKDLPALKDVENGDNSIGDFSD